MIVLRGSPIEFVSVAIIDQSADLELPEKSHRVEEGLVRMRGMLRERRNHQQLRQLLVDDGGGGRLHPRLVRAVYRGLYWPVMP